VRRPRPTITVSREHPCALSRPQADRSGSPSGSPAKIVSRERERGFESALLQTAAAAFIEVDKPKCPPSGADQSGPEPVDAVNCLEIHL
jgi:hypothetical protein